MLSIMRRRVSSGGSSSLILGQSFCGVQPAVSTPRIFTTSGDEVIHNSRGFGNVRNLCHLIFPGNFWLVLLSSLAPLLLRVKNIVCVEMKSCPKIFPVRSLHTISMSRISLSDYHKNHGENFFIAASTHPETTYVGPSPLCQQIVRELITSAYHLKKLNNMLFVPKLSDINLIFGEIGLLSITLDSCGLDQGDYVDPLVGYCTKVMSMLLEPKNLLELNDLEYVALHSKWWRDLDDIFLHPFFMTPQMHQAFVSNINILAYIPNVTGDMDATTRVKRQSLRKLAIEFHKSWIWRPMERNMTWVNQCTFVVPKVWKEAHDDKMALLRSVRNFLHHPCDDVEFFQTAAQWDHRSDHFMLIMNHSHNISATLFHAFWRLKEQFETHVNPGIDMVMWKAALSSVLPIVSVIYFLIVNGPEVLSKFVGETEKNVRDLFADAEQDQRTWGDQSDLHVIIFDEIDAICKSRGSTRDGTGVHDSIVNQLLTKVDGVESLNNVLLIGMTNRKDLLDEALLRPGPLEVQVEISLPDENGRLQILQIHTSKMKENSFLAPDANLH
ncbi:hypothetical protein RHGRI_018628 [Rhododendron griersonianum]|uniref:Vesicle-fusing ATPase n=1 Tax=Rhododendron griersonianum TaxID=479676 RepID=A0AAV6K278_9ERIC|nr:hypothetical protein RHGRI_018628 [Rhododendron griersonianum]